MLLLTYLSAGVGVVGLLFTAIGLFMPHLALLGHH
jgi:hypothetical protein